MTQEQIVLGNDEICQMLQFESDKVYSYKIPNTFPFEKELDTGWTEFNVQQILFHSDWNMLIGAYNRALSIMEDLPDGVHISSCWIKLVDFAKWFNQIKLLFK